MSVYNSLELINQILTQSGLQGQALENLKAKLAQLSEQELRAELTKLLSGASSTSLNKGISIEHSDNNEVSLDNYESPAYIDDAGRTITEYKEGDEVLERTIKSNDDNGNTFETTITYESGRPLTQVKSKNGNTIETSSYHYNDAPDEFPYVTIETKKSDRSVVTTNVLEVDENGDFSGEHFIDRQTITMDGTKTYIYTENNCVIEQQEKFDGKTKVTLYNGNSIEDYENEKLNRIYSMSEQNGECSEVTYDGNNNTKGVTVQNGESLKSIAKEFGCSVKALEQANADVLKGKQYKYFDVGAEIVIPGEIEPDEFAKLNENRKTAPEAKAEYAIDTQIREIKNSITSNIDPKLQKELSDNGFELSENNYIFYQRFNELDHSTQENVVRLIKYCKSQNITDPNKVKAKIFETLPDVNLFDSGKTIPTVGSSILGFGVTDLFYDPGKLISVEMFITDVLKLDLNTGDGQKIYSRLIQLPQETLNKISAKDFEHMANTSFDNVADRLGFVNIRTTVENQIENQKQIQRDEKLGLSTQKFASEILANMYDLSADMLEEFYNNHGAFDAGTYMEGWKNIIDWIIPIDKVGNQELRSTLHIAEDLRKDAESFRMMSTDNTQQFQKKFKELLGVDYNRKNVEEFMTLLQSGDIDYTDDKFKEACKKAFGFKGLEATEKNIKFWQTAGGIGDIALMLLTMDAFAELKGMQLATTATFTALEGVAGETAAKIGTNMLMGGLTLGGYTAVKETGNNLTNPMRDATAWETWKETLIASGESFGFGAAGGLLNTTVVEPVIKAIEKPAEQATRAAAKLLTESGEVSGKEVMETLLTAQKMSLSGITKMSSEEISGLIRSLTAKGVGFGIEVAGFTLYETAEDVIKDLCDPSTGRLPDEMTVESVTDYLVDKLGEQFSNLGTIKGISQLLMMIKGGKTGQTVMFNKMLDDCENLSEIKIKKAEIKGREVYEVTYPNGNKSVMHSTQEVINMCQIYLNLDMLLNAAEKSNENTSKSNGLAVRDERLIQPEAGDNPPLPSGMNLEEDALLKKARTENPAGVVADKVKEEWQRSDIHTGVEDEPVDLFNLNPQSDLEKSAPEVNGEVTKLILTGKLKEKLTQHYEELGKVFEDIVAKHNDDIKKLAQDCGKDKQKFADGIVKILAKEMGMEGLEPKIEFVGTGSADGAANWLEGTIQINKNIANAKELVKIISHEYTHMLQYGDILAQYGEQGLREVVMNEKVFSEDIKEAIISRILESPYTKKLLENYNALQHSEDGSLNEYITRIYKEEFANPVYPDNMEGYVGQIIEAEAYHLGTEKLGNSTEGLEVIQVGEGMNDALIKAKIEEIKAEEKAQKLNKEDTKTDGEKNPSIDNNTKTVKADTDSEHNFVINEDGTVTMLPQGLNSESRQTTGADGTGVASKPKTESEMIQRYNELQQEAAKTGEVSEELLCLTLELNEKGYNFKNGRLDFSYNENQTNIPNSDIPKSEFIKGFKELGLEEKTIEALEYNINKIDMDLLGTLKEDPELLNSTFGVSILCDVNPEDVPAKIETFKLLKDKALISQDTKAILISRAGKEKLESVKQEIADINNCVTYLKEAGVDSEVISRYGYSMAENEYVFSQEIFDSIKGDADLCSHLDLCFGGRRRFAQNVPAKLEAIKLLKDSSISPKEKVLLINRAATGNIDKISLLFELGFLSSSQTGVSERYELYINLQNIDDLTMKELLAHPQLADYYKSRIYEFLNLNLHPEDIPAKNRIIELINKSGISSKRIPLEQIVNRTNNENLTTNVQKIEFINDVNSSDISDSIKDVISNLIIGSETDVLAVKDLFDLIKSDHMLLQNTYMVFENLNAEDAQAKTKVYEYIKNYDFIDKINTFEKANKNNVNEIIMECKRKEIAAAIVEKGRDYKKLELSNDILSEIIELQSEGKIDSEFLETLRNYPLSDPKMAEALKEMVRLKDEQQLTNEEIRYLSLVLRASYEQIYDNYKDILDFYIKNKNKEIFSKPAPNGDLTSIINFIESFEWQKSAVENNEVKISHLESFTDIISKYHLNPSDFPSIWSNVSDIDNLVNIIKKADIETYPDAFSRLLPELSKCENLADVSEREVNFLLNIEDMLIKSGVVKELPTEFCDKIKKDVPDEVLDKIEYYLEMECAERGTMMDRRHSDCFDDYSSYSYFSVLENLIDVYKNNPEKIEQIEDLMFNRDFNFSSWDAQDLFKKLSTDKDVLNKQFELFEQMSVYNTDLNDLCSLFKEPNIETYDAKLEVLQALAPKLTRFRRIIRSFKNEDILSDAKNIVISTDEVNKNFIVEALKSESVTLNDLARCLNYITELNSECILSLIKNNKFSDLSEKLPLLAHITNMNGYCVNFIKENVDNFTGNCHDFCVIVGAVTSENKEFIGRLLQDKSLNFPAKLISDIASHTNAYNSDLIYRLCTDTELKFPPEYIDKIASSINNRNIECAEKLCTDKTLELQPDKIVNILSASDLISKDVNKLTLSEKINTLSILSNLPNDELAILRKYNIDIDYKMGELATSLGHKKNVISVPEEQQQLFVKNVIANNRPDVDEILTNFDFSQYGKEGLPLKYSRSEFTSNIENLLKNLSPQEQQIILDHFGLIRGAAGFDGLPTNKEFDSQKVSKEAKEAAAKIQKEIEDFTTNNEVNTGNAETDEILTGLLQGLPEFTSIVGKQQHGTHAYSVDIHTLKVLQSAMKNPLYENLPDRDKTILKISALLHDLGKKGSVVDTGHESLSAEYVSAILEKFPFPQGIKDRIIDIVDNHHWFEAYNTGKASAETIAVRCRRPEDFIIYEILAKADFENVNEDFHISRSGGVNNQKEFDEFFQKKMENIDNALSLMYSKANLVFDTKLTQNGSKFPTKKVEINGKEAELKVLDLNELSNNSSLQEFGFAPGVTKDNARFIVHMTNPDLSSMEPVRVLTQNSINQSTWSTSLISASNNRTYCNRKFGFIFDVDLANISEANYANTGSGCEKTIETFQDILFNANNAERTFVRDNLKNELSKKGIELDDNEYAQLAKSLMSKKFTTQIKTDLVIGDKTIKAEDLVECLENSRDKLFMGGNIHSEIVPINPRIKGLVAKVDKIEKCPAEFLEFAQKYDLPIILMKPTNN